MTKSRLSPGAADELELIAQDSDYEILMKIADLASQLGWAIAMPSGYGDEETLDHIILGTEAAIEEIDVVFDCYDLLVHESNSEGETYY